MNAITLITPTSDRPQAFRFCERWMARAMERFEGDIQWIVVDDGVNSVECHLGQTHLRRTPSDDRRSSFLDNLLTGLKSVCHDRVLFIEDDDWYSADYLHVMNTRLNEAEIVGEARAKYYDVPSRRYHRCGNRSHASLCQTGIRSILTAWMIDHIEVKRRTFIDVHLWKTGARNAQKLLIPSSSYSVGIKGMPGKQGIGMGHRLGESSHCDVDGSVLREWIGADDAEMYFALIDVAAKAAKGNS